METKTWLIPLIFLIIGMLIGFFIDFPNKFEIVFVVENKTQEWYSGMYDELNTTMTTWKNMCCFPQECEQAVNNPEQCTCEYLVKCFNTTGVQDER